jgi:hypothetical protein
LLATLALVQVAAVDAKVLATPAADRVVVELSGLPIALSLAHIQVPESIAASTIKELEKILGGKTASISHDKAWGIDASGTGKVHIRVGTIDLVPYLVEQGLAQVVPGAKADPTKDKLLAMTQDRARTAKKGLWGASMPSIASTAPSANPPPTGAFASELNNRFYYPKGHRALANVNAQRLIYYGDEAAAKKAGKVPAPLEEASKMGAPTEANADKIFAEGEKIYASAIAAGNTTKRDDLYQEAFVKLSDAMNVYGALVEKDENNEALAEKLRRCMQLRYGAMKQRRSTH